MMWDRHPVGSPVVVHCSTLAPTVTIAQAALHQWKNQADQATAAPAGVRCSRHYLSAQLHPSSVCPVSLSLSQCTASKQLLPPHQRIPIATHTDRSTDNDLAVNHSLQLLDCSSVVWSGSAYERLLLRWLQQVSQRSSTGAALHWAHMVTAGVLAATLSPHVSHVQMVALRMVLLVPAVDLYLHPIHCLPHVARSPAARTATRSPHNQRYGFITQNEQHQTAQLCTIDEVVQASLPCCGIWLADHSIQSVSHSLDFWMLTTHYLLNDQIRRLTPAPATFLLVLDSGTDQQQTSPSCFEVHSDWHSPIVNAYECSQNVVLEAQNSATAHTMKCELLEDDVWRQCCERVLQQSYVRPNNVDNDSVSLFDQQDATGDQSNRDEPTRGTTEQRAVAAVIEQPRDEHIHHSPVAAMKSQSRTLQTPSSVHTVNLMNVLTTPQRMDYIPMPHPPSTSASTVPTRNLDATCEADAQTTAMQPLLWSPIAPAAGQQPQRQSPPLPERSSSSVTTLAPATTSVSSDMMSQTQQQLSMLSASVSQLTAMMQNQMLWQQMQHLQQQQLPHPAHSGSSSSRVDSLLTSNADAAPTLGQAHDVSSLRSASEESLHSDRYDDTTTTSTGSNMPLHRSQHTHNSSSDPVSCGAEQTIVAQFGHADENTEDADQQRARFTEVAAPHCDDSRPAQHELLLAEHSEDRKSVV